MREAFHEQLQAILDELADMSDQVRVAVERATEALMTGDGTLAEEVISADADVDRAREEVEEQAFMLLSLQQPVASDLRVIVAALRIVTELERMGDLAVHVAKIARLRVLETAVPETARPLVEGMARVAIEMVTEVGGIIRHRDVRAALQLPETDQQIDHLRRRSFSELLAKDWPHGVEAAVDLALLGRYYERIADHAVSIANRVVFVVTGEQPVSS